MSSIQKVKKSRSKPAQGRPVATSQISQPVVEDLTSLSAFSPDGSLFAFLSLAVDKHRLRVYNTASCQSVAEYTVNSERVTTLAWTLLTLSSTGIPPPLEDPSAQPSQNKRRKRDSRAPVEEGSFASPNATSFIILGLSDGTISFFSPALGQIVRRLSNILSAASILSVASISTTTESFIWTSSADSTLRLWDVEKNDVLYSCKSDDRIPYTSISIRPDAVEEPDILVAHHSILLLSRAGDHEDSNAKPKQLSSFTGHTSSVKRTRWIHSKSPPQRFLSMAEADRFLYIWDIKDNIQGGGPVASIPLDSDARTFAISTLTGGDKQVLVTLSASGKISLFPIPSELSPPASNSRTHHKIPTLVPRCNVHSSSPKSSAQVVDVTFASEEQGILRVARIIKGVQPVFNVVHYLDDSGAFIPDVTLEGVQVAGDLNLHPYIPRNRYKESSTTVVRSGISVDQLTEGASSLQDVEGDLEVDLAELSLGQRLTAVTQPDMQHLSGSDDEGQLPSKTKSTKKRAQQEVIVVPANSLTRTIIQALHSSDTRLLETCLAHSDSVLIYNTVKRLPPQLAIPLVTACVERLGRGARASNAKGGGGGASSQRGTGLITWIKAVLTVHAGHLMTIPDLVVRLSGLHTTLTSRLALNESLLSLSGRLDMVISQIEMRSSVAPAPIATQKTKTTLHNQTKQVKRYVEGESESSEDEDGHMEVEIESAGDEGSVEEIELGGDTSEEEGTSEEDSDEAEDDFEDDDGPTMNGFIDDEAEEDSEEEDDESD